MSGHPIENLMKTTMESLKSMVDVNTVVGEPVETKDGTVIVPVSRVSFGFVAGGGDEAAEGQSGGQDSDSYDQAGGAGQGPMPFTGGSGAGVTVKPVGFLVVGIRKVRFIPVDNQAIYDRLLDEAPELLDKLANAIGGREGVENLVDRAKDITGNKRDRRDDGEVDRHGEGESHHFRGPRVLDDRH